MKNLVNISKITLSISILTAIILFTACNINCIQGKGNIVKNERETASFENIEVSGAFNIILTQDSIKSVVVEADDNLQKYITAEVKNNKLVIKNNEPICGSKEMNVYIKSPVFKNIDLSGAVNLQTINKLVLPILSIDLSGACEINLDLAVQNLDIESSGSTDIIITGNATTVDLDASGASEINAFDLLTENFSIESSGSAEAKICVSKLLDVDISGAGSVLYKGTPVINQNISGAGNIKKSE